MHRSNLFPGLMISVYHFKSVFQCLKYTEGQVETAMVLKEPSVDYRNEAILTAEKESELLQEGRREENESRDPDIDGRDGKSDCGCS